MLSKYVHVFLQICLPNYKNILFNIVFKYLQILHPYARMGFLWFNSLHSMPNLNSVDIWNYFISESTLKIKPTITENKTFPTVLLTKINHCLLRIWWVCTHWRAEKLIRREVRRLRKLRQDLPRKSQSRRTWTAAWRSA